VNNANSEAPQLQQKDFNLFYFVRYAS